MAIQWFPGHMHKARKEIADTLKNIDVVIEVLDARLPYSSSNPLVSDMAGFRSRPILKILNKSDLADPNITQLWLNYLRKQPRTQAISLSDHKKPDLKKVLLAVKQLAPHRGTFEKPLRLLIVGIPNVGKSTLINALVGKRVAKTGDEPAITKAQQKIDLGNGIELCDTPGILWPKIEDPASGYRLAASGAVGKTAIDFYDVAFFATEFLKTHYPQLLQSRYKLKTLDLSIEDLMLTIGSQRACLKAGRQVDEQKTAEMILFELKGGHIGRISLEKPSDIPSTETVQAQNPEAAEVSEITPISAEIEEPTQDKNIEIKTKDTTE